MTEYQKTFESIMDIVKDKPHIKTLLEGSLNMLITQYESECATALANLYHAVPSQSNDKDWWPDELNKAMKEAAKLV